MCYPYGFYASATRHFHLKKKYKLSFALKKNLNKFSKKVHQTKFIYNVVSS